MIKLRQPINETSLMTNLNELAQAFVRELAMACRKIAVYGSSHPTAARALEKPFFVLDEIFRFKNHANVNLHDGSLYVLNINLKRNVFTEEITRYLLILDVEALLFHRLVTMAEVGRFVDRLVKRVNRSSYENLLGAYLEKNGIDSIEVNTEKAFRLFESHKKYRGDIHGDFSVKGFALQQFSDKLELLADINSREQVALDEHNIDFHIDLVKYLFPERVASISHETITNDLKHLLQQVNSAENEQQRESILETYRSRYCLTDYHPQREQIVTAIESYISEQKLSRTAADQLGSSVSAIRIESSERIDHVLDEILGASDEDYDVDAYRDAFQRLLKTGLRGKAMDVLKRLMESLSSPEASHRQKALDLWLGSVKSLQLPADAEVFESAVERVSETLAQKKETFEHSEIIRQLFEKCLVTRRFDLMAHLTKAMARRRKIDNKVTVYDSMAIKKAYENINRRETIDALIDDMIKADFETSGYLRETLIAIGSEEVALALSQIISHPVRQVRQQTLKVLAELGNASLQVFSRILMDDVMFEREAGRHELPDSKWYVIRNSIFVLGSLQDPEGVAPLRLRISDKDVRIRREIVSALEKIGGEEACDLLVLMADDKDREIRESAVIAVGLIGQPGTAPMLIDLAHRNPLVAVRAISALGKIGGDESQTYLIKLLEDESEFDRFAAGRISKDELRVAAIKALGQIGSEKSIASIKGYKEKLNPAQKFFFKNSSINKVISDILARH